MRVLLKREDLTHTGSHKINNVLGQALLTRRMGKQRVIAETGAGQHGVAIGHRGRAVRPRLPGVHGRGRRRASGASTCSAWSCWAPRSIPVTGGSATLKDAINEALRDWVATVETTHYCIGSVVGPHPYPWMVREFQRVVGDEAREQCRAVLGGDDPDSSSRASAAGRTRSGTFAGFLDTRAAARRRGGRRATASSRGSTARR